MYLSLIHISQDLAAAAKENGLENGSKNEPENGPVAIDSPVSYTHLVP